MIETEPRASAIETTARWTAAVRAVERTRADRLFDDPWAATLAGPEGMAWVEARPPDSLAPIAIRTRYFDDWLEAILGRRRIGQVVLLAAGLDTRAYRLAWPPDTACFEVDRPQVVRSKEAVLAGLGATPRCTRTTVEGDLTATWSAALLDAGLDAARPAAWLLEGCLFYLPSDAIVRILDCVTALSPAGSMLGFDIVNEAVLTSPWTKAWIDMQAAAGAPWIGSMEDPVAFLADRGWRATLTQAGQPDANHGRWTLPVIPTTQPGMPHNWFVTAERLD